MPSKKRRQGRRASQMTRSRSPLSQTQLVGEGDLPDSDRLDAIRQETEERYRKKQIRRRIRSEFRSLDLKTRTSDLESIAEFITRYSDHLDLMREALESERQTGSFATVVVWRYLSGHPDERLQYLVSSNLSQARRGWIEAKLSDPIEIKVKVTEQGPAIRALGDESIRMAIREKLGYAAEFQMQALFPDSPSDDIVLQLEFPEGFALMRKARRVLLQEALPPDCIESMTEAALVPTSGTSEVLQALRQYLVQIPSDRILEYFPRMSSVLKTGYLLGYWKTPWVQAILREWRDRREEYDLNRKLQDVRECVDQIKRNGPWILPEEYDVQLLSEEKVLDLARGIVSRSIDLSRYSVELRLGGDVHRATLPIRLSMQGVPVGEFPLFRTASFMPADIRQEIQRAGVGHLREMVDCTSDERLIEIANRENRVGLRILDDKNRADYPARARYLAGI